MPDMHALVLAGGGEDLAVGPKIETVNRIAVPLEDVQLLPRRRLPEARRRVAAAGGQGLAVGAEGDEIDPAGMALVQGQDHRRRTLLEIVGQARTLRGAG